MNSVLNKVSIISIYLSIIIINYEIYLFIFLLRTHFARGSLRFSANSFFLLLEQNFSKLKIMNFFEIKCFLIKSNCN